MAITEAYSGSVATSGTEWSMTTNTAGPALDTSDGVFQIFVDTTAMVSGSEIRIRVYEKVRAADTQEIVFSSNLVGIQSSVWVSPSLVLLHGWDATVVAIAGTATVTWSIRKVA